MLTREAMDITVTFNANSGHLTSAEKISVKYGTAILETTQPAYTDHEFECLYDKYFNKK